MRREDVLKMEKQQKLKEDRGDSQGTNELKHSLGLLQISTGLLYLVIFLIYWIFLSSIITFVVGLLEEELLLVLLQVINGVFIFFAIVSVLNLIFGTMALKNYSFNTKLEKILKINSILSLSLFPIGTISGLIVLKNFKQMVQ